MKRLIALFVLVWLIAGCSSVQQIQSSVDTDRYGNKVSFIWFHTRYDIKHFVATLDTIFGEHRSDADSAYLVWGNVSYAPWSSNPFKINMIISEEFDRESKLYSSTVVHLRMNNFQDLIDRDLPNRPERVDLLKEGASSRDSIISFVNKLIEASIDPSIPYHAKAKSPRLRTTYGILPACTDLDYTPEYAIPPVITYPDEARENRAEGVIMVEFSILRDGSVADPIILKHGHPALERQALSIARNIRFKALPKDITPCTYLFSINFKFDR